MNRTPEKKIECVQFTIEKYGENYTKIWRLYGLLCKISSHFENLAK